MKPLRFGSLLLAWLVFFSCVSSDEVTGPPPLSSPQSPPPSASAVTISASYTESFTGVAGALSGTWAQQRTSGTINRTGSGTGAGSINAKDLFAFWSGNTFNNDQYSQVRITSGLASSYQYVTIIVRASGKGEGLYNGYLFYTDGLAGAGHTEVAKNINGSQITLRSFPTTFASGDVIKIDAVGATITCYKNGVAVGSITDTSLPSGAAGVGVYGSSVRIDDWEGGSYGAATPPAPVASVSVTPASASLVVGATQQLSATTKDNAGNTLSGRTISWTSDAPTVATVSASGVVTAVAAGAATITATSEGQSGTSSITVAPVPVAAVVVSPSAASIAVGQTQQLTATAKDANGATLTGRSVTWTSDNPMETVDATGLVQAQSAGSATITATCEGKSGTASISVAAAPAPVATIEVSPTSASIVAGSTQQLTATVRDASNNVLTGRSIAWSSNAGTVAGVSGSGVVTGVSAGSATITATSEGQSATSAITVTAPPPSSIAGPLRVSSANSRYFADPTGRIVYLTGSHYWKNLQDDGPSNPPAAFDNNAYLDFLQSHNHNFTRLWVWEQAKWSAETSIDHWFSPALYVRTGPGTALDGGARFDLNRINPDYLARVRQRVIDAGARGIYVSVMFFDGWSIETKPGYTSRNPWQSHPFNAANNINGINGDPNGDQSGRETQTLSIPAVTALQDAYVRAVVDAVNDLDNVIYEISNESDASGNAWQAHMIDLIRSYESTKSKRHPIGMTIPWPGSNSDLFVSSADWISMNGDTSNPYPMDGAKVSLLDTDHLCGICGDVAWVWKALTRGHNPLLMDGYDGSAGVGDPIYHKEDPKWEAIRKNLGYARSYALRMDLSHAVPRGDLSSTGYCLAVVGSEYLAFSQYGGALTVRLTSVRGTRVLEWFNPATGQTIAGGTVTGGTTVKITPPFSGAAVAYIHP